MNNIVRIRPSQDELSAPGFSEWDDATIHDLFGSRIWRAAQQLLITQSELERSAGSFGVDPKKVLERIRVELKDFREATIEQWRDSQ